MSDSPSFHLYITVDPTSSTEELALLPNLKKEVTEAVPILQEKQHVYHQTGSARQTEHLQHLHNLASSFCFRNIGHHRSLFPTLPAVGYHTFVIHHTGTCLLQKSNSGVKILEESSLRTHELLLLFTRLQMHSPHDSRNTGRFFGFSLTQHSGTQANPTQHTLTFTLCNSMTST